MNDEPLGFIRRDDNTKGMNVAELTIAYLNAQLKEKKAESERLRARLYTLVHDMDELMDNSDGVAGLHRNGEVAIWEELTRGGRYEGWLTSLDEARDLVGE